MSTQRKILWSNEAVFKLHVHVYRHNVAYWSDTNPRQKSLANLMLLWSFAQESGREALQGPPFMKKVWSQSVPGDGKWEDSVFYKTAAPYNHARQG